VGGAVMSGIPDISHPQDLSPKRKYFDEVGDHCLNVDACIELARTIDTPNAKAIYHAFRRRNAEFRMRADLTPEKQREEAWFAALADLGVRTTFTKIAGTME
jgi:hypothetical protein